MKIPSVNDGSNDTHVTPLPSLLKKLPGAPFKFLESYNSLCIEILPSISKLIEPSFAKLDGFVVPKPTVPKPVITTLLSPSFA